MVLSKINSSVNYPDTMKLEDVDKKMTKDIYEIEIFGVDALIIIGEQVNKFSKNNIIYFPIYLIKHNRKALQIGVYEFDKKQITFSMFEDDNDELLELIAKTSPLLYSFVDRDFILKLYLSPERYLNEEEEKKIQLEQNESKNNENAMANINNSFRVSKKKINNIPIETSDDAKTYRANFASARNTSNYWMQKFMKNIFYKEVDNEGCGDCFFATVRDAYKSIGLETTVANLRQIISDRITTEQFNVYSTLYNDNKNELENIKNNKKEKKEEKDALRQRYYKTTSKTEKKELLDKMNELQQEIDDLEGLKRILNEAITNYTFMKTIKSLEELKTFVKTSNYWADEWAVEQLEIALKVKFIIFLEDNYLNKDFQNVLQCQSGAVNEEIERNNKFDVKYYIMLNYGGSHYKLITYKDKAIFTFDEIPYDVKVMIADKCLEKMAGIFSYIKEFTKFKTELNEEREEQEGKGEGEGEGEQEGGGEDSDGQIMEELYQFGKKKLWDDDVKLYFYHNSSDVIPGKAPGEKIPKDKIRSFSKLSKIKDWRKKLDNFWVQPFILDNKTWASVEHYYQGSKFKNDNYDFYEKFSMDSKSSLSKNPFKAKELGENKNKRPGKINVDKKYNKTIGNVNMYSAQEAKFIQHDDLAKALMATNNANLYCHRKGKSPIQNTNLMLIRKNINS